VLLQVFDHWHLEIYGAILLLVMRLRPQGVLALDLHEGLLGLWQRLCRRTRRQEALEKCRGL
jgi:hypothetical protein